MSGVWTAPTHDTLRARMARVASPDYSYCGRCGMPWSRVEGHVTNYGEGRGCFPLCEGCWDLLGCPEARIEYYANLIRNWENLGPPVEPETRRAIQRAVANEGAA